VRALLYKMRTTTTEADERGNARLKNSAAIFAKKALAPVPFLHWNSKENHIGDPTIENREIEIGAEINGYQHRPAIESRLNTIAP